MARFPLFLDLQQNNCVIVGGGHYAASAAELLLRFGAKVTVISPVLCDALRALDEAGKIRYIPRRYFRGDCVNAYLTVAATNVKSVNIAIAEECKARRIPVNVSLPDAYGTFSLPQIAACGDMIVSVHGEGPAGGPRERMLCDKLQALIPQLLRESEDSAATTE